MSAPTEEQIRAAIEARGAVGYSGIPKRDEGETELTAALRGVVEDYAGPLSSPATLLLDITTEDWGDTVGEGDDDALWGDLRPSEAYRLRAIVREAVRRARDRCEAIILEELTAAGLTFAAEYPDAPRAKVPTT